MADPYWGKGNEIGALYEMTEVEEQTKRIHRGCSGDIYVCLMHTGDHHYQYARLDRVGTGREHSFMLAELVPGYACSDRVYPHYQADESTLFRFLASGGHLDVPAKSEKDQKELDELREKFNELTYRGMQ